MKKIEEIKNRIKAVQDLLIKKRMDGIITLNSDDIRYLSGYTGEFALMLVLVDKALLITHFRNDEKIEKEVSGCQVSFVKSDKLLTPKDLYQHMKIHLQNEEVGYMAIEEGVSHSDLLALRKCLKPIKLKCIGIIASCRMIKSEYEIMLLKKSQDINEKILKDFLPQIIPGKTEKQLHHELLSLIYADHDLEGPSFLPIIASSESAWTIHSYYTNRKLKKGDSVIIDMGVKYNGYCSDMTRTVFLGTPKTQQKEVYNLVLKSQNAAMVVTKAGVYNHTVDNAARKIIEDGGYGIFFSHGLGHSIGMGLHEAPYLSYVKKRKRLMENMIFTIEPGIYIKKKFGVRIEDMIIIKKNSFENITHFTKEIITL